MDARVCKNCRRLFNYIYGPEFCPECSKLLLEEKVSSQQQEPENEVKNASNSPFLKPLVKDEEKKYEQVRDYIMTHPNASVKQIAEENDILPAKLFSWIKDDRLEFSDNSEYAWFQCERCGTKIRSGRFCNRCKSNK